MSRSVIIVSPYFPPSNLAGVHRARHLAKHLPAASWTPIVLCVDEAFHEQTLDPSLAQLVPPSTEIVKVAALPVSATRWFGLGDISLRAWFGLRRALVRLLQSRPVGVVLITGAPYYPLLMASMIKHRFGVPVVLDFQDPWISRWGDEQRTWTKAHLSHRLAIGLEPRAVRNADFITSVSEIQNKEMAARYPWLDTSSMASIPIGGDPDDFAYLRRNLQTTANDFLIPDHTNLSFVGTVMPRSGPLVRLLLRGFRHLRLTRPKVAERIRLNFVGTSNQPNDNASFSVLTAAKELGVADAVREIPRRLPYFDALGTLVRSDGLLLIGSDEPHYTASKIYPSLMSQRPYLSLFHRDSSAHEILAAAGGGITLAFTTAEELELLEPAMSEGLQALATAPQTLGQVNACAYAPYEARVIARRYADIFDLVSPKARAGGDS